MKLDDIRAAAERKYGHLPVEVGDRTVKLLNPLRLPKGKRDAMMALQETAKDDGVDQEAMMREMIRLAADKDAAGAELLIEAVGDDLALLAEIVNEYGKGTRQGEASA